jgi:hypothetical protein
MVNVLHFLVYLEQERLRFSNVLQEKLIPQLDNFQSMVMMLQLLQDSKKQESKLVIVHNLMQYLKV